MELTSKILGYSLLRIISSVRRHMANEKLLAENMIKANYLTTYGYRSVRKMLISFRTIDKGHEQRVPNRRNAYSK